MAVRLAWRRGGGPGSVAILTVLAAVAVTSGAAGCSQGSNGSSPHADSAFLSEVHESAPDIGTARSDTQLIRLGHAACDGFSAGASYEQLADRLVLQEGSNTLPTADLGAVITAAADNYCPKYRDQVG